MTARWATCARLLVSPLPRWFLLFCKLLAGTAVSLLQVYAFLLIAWFWDIAPPPIGYLTVLPALILSGLMLGALGMLISSGIKQLENFAGVMNFVIFPMFFASSALYPLWRVQEGSPMLYYVCLFNPFTHAVELIRFALYGQINWISLAVVGGCTAVFMIGAIHAYDPSRGLIRRGPAGGEDMKWRIAIGALLALAASAEPRCRRSALSGLALRAGQGAGDFARRGMGRPAARRCRGQMEGRRQGQRAGVETGGEDDAARGSREGDQGISGRLRGRQDHERKAAVRRPVRHASTPSAPRS